MTSLRVLLDNPDVAEARGVAHEAPAAFRIEDEVGLVTRATHLLATASVNDRVIAIHSIGKHHRANGAAERIVVGRDDPLERMRPGPSGRHC